MGPHAAAAIVLLLCLALVVLAYELGIEVGRATRVPGGATGAAPSAAPGA